jgi:gluconate 5-dehydrogenase
MSSPSTLFDLSGRTALITGGGTGIGAVLAQGLAEAGAKVVLVGRREAPLIESCESINTKAGRLCAYACPADICDTSSLSELVDKVQTLTGKPPTILVNNAGVNVRQSFDALTEDHWRTSLDLMLSAPFFLARACAPGMKAEKYGRIISIASLQVSQPQSSSLLLTLISITTTAFSKTDPLAHPFVHILSLRWLLTHTLSCASPLQPTALDRTPPHSNQSHTKPSRTVPPTLLRNRALSA